MRLPLIRRRAAAALLASAFACAAAAVQGADGMTAYASVLGAGGGTISQGASSFPSTGSPAIPGREDDITVLGWDQALLAPLDPATGLPYGRPVHQGYRLTKPVDFASPRLQQALATGDRLEIELDLFRTDPTGFPEHYYTVRLQQTRLVGLEQRGANEEELLLMPRRIEQIHNIAGTSSVYDTIVPVGISSFSVE